MSQQREINTTSTENTAKLAQLIASQCIPRDVITLDGQLGTGKTTFSRAFIQSLSSPDVEVTSPTFNILQTYECSKATVWHFDLYRIADARELFEIGTEDAFTRGISLIEWPEIAENDLPEDRLAISLSYDKNDDDTRHITIRGNSRWKVLFEDIDKEWK